MKMTEGDNQFPNYLVVTLHLIYTHTSNFPEQIYEDTLETFINTESITCQLTTNFTTESPTSGALGITTRPELH